MIAKSNQSLESYKDLAAAPCKKWISFVLNTRMDSEVTEHQTYNTFGVDHSIKLQKKFDNVQASALCRIIECRTAGDL